MKQLAWILLVGLCAGCGKGDQKAGLECRDGAFYYEGAKFTDCAQCGSSTTCKFIDNRSWSEDSFGNVMYGAGTITGYCDGQSAMLQTVAGGDSYCDGATPSGSGPTTATGGTSGDAGVKPKLSCGLNPCYDTAGLPGALCCAGGVDGNLECGVTVDGSLCYKISGLQGVTCGDTLCPTAYPQALSHGFPCCSDDGSCGTKATIRSVEMCYPNRLLSTPNRCPSCCNQSVACGEPVRSSDGWSCLEAWPSATYPQKSCDGASPTPACRPLALGTDRLIDDVEDGDARIRPVDGRDGFWLTDRTGGPVSERSAILPEKGGPNGSLYYAFNQWAGWGLVLQPNRQAGRACPFDASSATGIAFRLLINQRNPIRFEIKTMETTTPAEGGTCATACGDHFHVDMSPMMYPPSGSTDQWLVKNFAWGDFRRSADAEARWDGTGMLELHWYIVASEPGESGIRVDNLEFVRAH